MIINKLRFRRLGLKLGFSIGYNVFDYGLVIPHYGTIVVGTSNKCGRYCVLHSSTCISDNGKKIGDALYLSTGAKMTSKCCLGNNISVGANSLVNKSFSEDNLLLVGSPALIKRNRNAWYLVENGVFKDRVELIENLRKELNL